MPTSANANLRTSLHGRLEETKADCVFLEFGLLLMVTGLFVVVLVTALVFLFSRESTIASSWPLATISVLAVSGLLALVLFLARRLKRFIAYR